MHTNKHWLISVYCTNLKYNKYQFCRIECFTVLNFLTALTLLQSSMHKATPTFVTNLKHLSLPTQKASGYARLLRKCFCDIHPVFMTHFVTKVAPTNRMTSNCQGKDLNLFNQSQRLDITPYHASSCLWPWGRTHTHAHTYCVNKSNTKKRPACAWLKKEQDPS